MRINRNTTIDGATVVLVPYRESHVEKYHQWMKSTELQELTASEPLSLEEEYAMQRSWREDENKCTFIVLDKDLYEETGHDEVAAMIGDTNLFLTDSDDPTMAEAEIMIAETRFRGKKRGWEAILLMLRYGMENLGITKYEVKIGLNNMASIKMFEKMQFKEESRSEVFEEVTLNSHVTETWKSWLMNNIKQYVFNIEELASINK
ncbi:unnamed protein product [Meganyctiphanes norvegica]|uniref:N-acetyltransferase domain-containing protein n=1 Tax=Meganyctiphanes norvegica TaxID=48144 RepID=A0AAV2QS51_MEGNR